MTDPARPLLQAIVAAAVDATGAQRGWLLRADGQAFVVAAAADTPSSTAAVGDRRDASGVAGYALASGQPAAVQLRPDDPTNDGAGGGAGVPRSVLAAPCAADEVLGVLELADAPGGTFSFDDVETVALLADIAGVALAETGPAEVPPPPPQLAAGLDLLARTDPGRYAVVARAVGALL